MTDSDKIYAAIAELRGEIMREFRDRRGHVDEEFRRVHDRIDEMHDRIEPLTIFAKSRNFLWQVTLGFVTICGIIGGTIFAALRYFGT